MYLVSIKGLPFLSVLSVEFASSVSAKQISHYYQTGVGSSSHSQWRH